MKKFLLLIPVLLLSGCAEFSGPQQAQNQALSWQTRQYTLQQLTSWQVQGAMALRTDKQAENASFYLKQSAEQYQLQIYGPLGIGRNILTGNSQGVTLKNASGQTFRATSAEQLIQEHLGWNLPVSNLRYWLRSLPAPRLSKKIIFDKYHHISELQQQGWSIYYINYMAVKQFDLPHKIILQRAQLRAVIVINHWYI